MGEIRMVVGCSIARHFLPGRASWSHVRPCFDRRCGRTPRAGGTASADVNGIVGLGRPGCCASHLRSHTTGSPSMDMPARGDAGRLEDQLDVQGTMWGTQLTFTLCTSPSWVCRSSSITSERWTFYHATWHSSGSRTDRSPWSLDVWARLPRRICAFPVPVEMQARGERWRDDVLIHTASHALRPLPITLGSYRWHISWAVGVLWPESISRRGTTMIR